VTRKTLSRLATFAFLALASKALAVKEPVSEAPKPTALAIGAPAPSIDVKMTGVDGKATSIADAKGAKGTLVLFTCNHCPFVKKWQDRIVAIGNDALGKGIGVIAVNANDPGAVPEDGLDGMKQLATAKGYKFAYVVDAGSSVARAFGAGRTPEAFLIDADSKLVYHGAVDDNVEDAAGVQAHWLSDAVKALAAGEPIAVKETKALGCSIKFASQS
jgi:peroxiredoxin